ncbi:sigma-70 family RNA polymerase sigma factor [Dermatobacter hominis]|uniref:sigma-70 family RNA polymerase sigma factor n=1 Tax=Dermatobacter hominis TaxID=2884263 RepID=UPI001D12C14E|nr:sigma-70 family RNA polymerase sigma factor [Dermatobacter hominis]UDY37536.1 sigma-70 family RNA polymerase sigma factor [Dermatobacter hominis]
MTTMDPEETDQLLATYRRTGQRRYRNQVVEAHLDAVGYSVRRFARAQPHLADDLQQVALLAIVRAADRYRPDRGASFRTFAGRTIDGELKRYLRDRTWTVRPPRGLQEQFLRVCRARDELTHELGRSPKPSEIAERSDLTLDEVLQGIEAGSSRTSSELEPQRDDGGMSTHAELVSWEGGFDMSEHRADLVEAIGVLDSRERELLHLRYVEERSQQEIGEMLGLSQSYVSRVLRSSLARLREAMGDELPQETATLEPA